MIGIPFLVKDEKLKKYVDKLDRKESEAFALDKDGRRRFHGAFTGGFSAGYWNTCGSKEGWTPSEFKSSRSDPQKQQKQSVLDFMDEEDLGEHEAGRTITASKDYQDTTGELERRLLSQNLGSHGLLGRAPDELIVQSHQSMGYQLLKKLGWRPGYRAEEGGLVEEDEQDEVVEDEREAMLLKIKALQKQKDQPPAAEKYYRGPLRAKTDGFGVGYAPTEMDLKGLGVEGFAQQKKPTKRAKFADDDEVYFEESRADFEEYELEEGAATQQEKSKKVEPEFIEPKFEAKEVVRCHVIEEAAVSVPEDYTPFLTQVSSTPLPGGFGHRAPAFSNGRKIQWVNDPKLRRALLEDEDQEEAEANFQFPQNKREAGKLARRFYKDEKESKGGGALPKTASIQVRFAQKLPFLEDKEKMRRFQAFVAEQEGNFFDAGGMLGNLMNASALKAERQEFQKIYDRNQEVEAAPVAEKAKPRGRQFLPWTPCELLCKRFGVLVVKKNQKKREQQKREVKKQEFTSAGVVSGNQYFASVAQAVVGQEQTPMPPTTLDKPIEETPQVVENELASRKSIFKAIFSDEDDQ